MERNSRAVPSTSSFARGPFGKRGRVPSPRPTAVQMGSVMWFPAAGGLLGERGSFQPSDGAGIK